MKVNYCTAKFRCPIKLGRQILKCKFFDQNIVGFCAYWDRDKKRSCTNQKAREEATRSLVAAVERN